MVPPGRLWSLRVTGTAREQQTYTSVPCKASITKAENMNDDIDNTFRQLAEMSKSEQWRRRRAEYIADRLRNGDDPTFLFAPSDLELLENWPLDNDDAA